MPVAAARAPAALLVAHRNARDLAADPARLGVRQAGDPAPGFALQPVAHPPGEEIAVAGNDQPVAVAHNPGAPGRGVDQQAVPSQDRNGRAGREGQALRQQRQPVAQPQRLGFGKSPAVGN